MAGRPKIGLALGTGGARGWCHIGAIRALAEIGVEVDVIAGCSMGALVGAAHAGGRLEDLAAMAGGLNWRNVLALMDMRLKGGGIVGGAGIGDILGRIGLDGRIEDLALPFLAVATCLETGQEVWLRDGTLADAVRASAAMPGVFAPAGLAGRWLVDGGLVNPVPVSAARAMGAKVVIAINPNYRSARRYWQPGAPSALRNALTGLLPDMPEALRGLRHDSSSVPEPGPPPYFETVTAAIDIMSDRIRLSRLAVDPPDVMLGASLPELGVFEFHRAAEAIEEGARMVRAQADLIRDMTGTG